MSEEMDIVAVLKEISVFQSELLNKYVSVLFVDL